MSDLKRVFREEDISDRTMRDQEWGNPVVVTQTSFVKVAVHYHQKRGQFRIVAENINGLRRVDYCHDVHGTFASTGILSEADKAKLGPIMMRLARETFSNAANENYRLWSVQASMSALTKSRGVSEAGLKLAPRPAPRAAVKLK